jgi:hypothetical protein
MYVGKKVYSMYSAAFIRFLIGYNVDEFVSTENKQEKHEEENKMIRFARLATVPIHIRD